ncbi:hypothetical protein [Caudoviricetes sp.]|nr:hypothetical protein [Caudoviricetes sp.]
MPYMEWKTDHRLLAKKIQKRIEEAEGDVPYSELEARAVELDISIDMLDAALEHLQRFKKVKQRVKGNEIIYKAKPKSVPKDPFAVSTWMRENYPWPTPCGAEGCTGLCKQCEPFPEMDLSWIFLKPQEMKEFKAQMKGMPLHVMNKRIQDRIKKATQS